MHPALTVISSAKLQKTVSLICQHIRAKDPATLEHSIGVEAHSARMAAILSNDPKFIARVRVAALVHDVGKIALPASILLKQGPLTPAEHVQVRMHPMVGYEYLRAFPPLETIARITLYHHEWWSGQGYPSQIYGDRIPLEARIICIADAFEAMTGTRTYKHPVSQAAALDELVLCSGTQFDPELVGLFVESCKKEQYCNRLQNAKG